MPLHYYYLSIIVKHYYEHIRHTSATFDLICFTCYDPKPSNKSCRLNAACRVNPPAQELEYTLVVEARQPHLLTESIRLLYAHKGMFQRVTFEHFIERFTFVQLLLLHCNESLSTNP